MNMKRVIIWGVDDYNTLGLFRELGKYNLDITFLIISIEEASYGDNFNCSS